MPKKKDVSHLLPLVIQETLDRFYKVIPLSYLLKHSHIFSGLSSSEVSVAKAIRSLATDVLDLRMVFTSPSWSEWYGKPSSSKDVGNYEIRRTDWRRDFPDEHARRYSKDDWDKRTLYLV